MNMRFFQGYTCLEKSDIITHIRASRIHAELEDKIRRDSPHISAFLLRPAITQVNFKKLETNELLDPSPSFSVPHSRFPEAQFHVRIIDCMRSSFVKSRKLRLIQGDESRQRIRCDKGKERVQKIERTSSNTFYKTRPSNFIYLKLGFSISFESTSAMPNMNIDYGDRY